MDLHGTTMVRSNNVQNHPSQQYTSKQTCNCKITANNDVCSWFFSIFIKSALYHKLQLSSNKIVYGFIDKKIAVRKRAIDQTSFLKKNNTYML